MKLKFAPALQVTQ